MATQKQLSDFITQCRQVSTREIEDRATLQALRWEWDKEYNSELADDDFIGENLGLTRADIVALMVTQGNLETFMDAGNGANLLAVST